MSEHHTPTGRASRLHGLILIHAALGLILIHGALGVSTTHPADLTFNTDGHNAAYNCHSRDVLVNSDSNSLRIAGHCHSVTVLGSDNRVIVDSVDRIATQGANNTVHWRSGKEPQISNTGRHNIVSSLLQSTSGTLCRNLKRKILQQAHNVMVQQDLQTAEQNIQQAQNIHEVHTGRDSVEAALDTFNAEMAEFRRACVNGPTH